MLFSALDLTHEQLLLLSALTMENAIYAHEFAVGLYWKLCE